MSKKSKRDLAKLDALVTNFDSIRERYPDGGYEKTTRELRQQRVEVANKIGRKPR